jgi:ATP-binding cassette subfamily B (MDR/TAP) protein 1
VSFSGTFVSLLILFTDLHVYIDSDEVTLELDPTSCILVFEALKRWHKNNATIVITHDLSQIEPGNFVYVFKTGKVVHGFRRNFEAERAVQYKVDGM